MHSSMTHTHTQSQTHFSTEVKSQLTMPKVRNEIVAHNNAARTAPANKTWERLSGRQGARSDQRRHSFS